MAGNNNDYSEEKEKKDGVRLMVQAVTAAVIGKLTVAGVR